ncbi:GDSL-type esterase/lipase family protein [Pyxidicoccus xibeiensis]|uniref:GDSL-type esterase/lipase family protein n=1 Tax=Pyxidicoccus xibeiensis TaxID=2906759 RepID=UPI0020A74393|nr:GDSL-type esterase/lipase family protein [Pyxidicoccus xibeiensis]MCP3143863.1 GDSL-type esterase/lipase family protein [Pyxidicoccus xibeiensis]
MTSSEVRWGGRRAWFPVLASSLLLAACEIGSEPRRLTSTATVEPAPAPTASVGSSIPQATPTPAPVVVAPSAEPTSVRRMPARPARTQAIQELVEKLGAPGAKVDDPCVAPEGSGCARTALAPFFEALDALAAGTSSRPTVIEAFGNSLIAGDRIVDILRDDLGEAFGSAGRGLLLVDRMAPYGGRSRTGYSRGGWEPRTLGELRAPPLPFGIAGVYHVATTAKARSRFTVEGESQGTLWWLDVPRAGALTVSSEGQVLARTEPAGDGAARITRFELPPGAKSVEVVAEGKGAVVQGVVLQQSRPGIVLDMLGVPSADAGLYARMDDGILRAQLAERAPRLLLFFLGGNESKRIEWKRMDLEKLRTDLRALLRRSREAAPDSACMVVGPMDAVQGPKAKDPLKARPFLEAVVTAEREVATAEGCAFFDMYGAMGGKGSLARFHKAGFMHEDLVHPRSKGLDVLGHLVTDALLRAWVETPPATRKVAMLRPAASSPSTSTAEAAP